MSQYETDDQQVAALKKWWKENGTSLLVGLLVGVSALFGWRYYDEQKNMHSIQASDLYMQVIQSVKLKTVNDKIIDINNTLINDYSGTPYAALSSLALAKTEYERGNVDLAVSQLELAVKYAADEVTRQIASLRLASVLIEQKKFEKVLELLDAPHDVAFDAQYEELKGDMHMAKNEIEQARVAYDKAITIQGPATGKWLKLKRQNLGASKVGAEESSEIEPAT
jgi:predicted negative regulator of RcsB-dependent stress response